MAEPPQGERRPGPVWPWLTLAVLVLAAAILYPDGLAGLDARAARALGVLLATVTLWVSRALPLGVTSLLAVGLLIVTGASPGFPAAAQGFASATVFFLVSASLIAQAVANAGLIERIARGAARASGTRPSRALTLVATLTGASALVMPSALVRAKSFIPVLHGLAGLLADERDRVRFLAANGLVLGLLGHVASISIITGGGMSIVAAGTIAEFHQRLSWLDWFLMMALPGVSLMVVTVFVISRLFPLGGTLVAAASTADGAEDAVGSAGEPAVDEPAPAPAGDAPARAGEPPLGRREVFTVVVLCLTLAAWLLGGQVGLDLAVPAIVAAAIFALPPVGLVTAASLQRQNWDEILVVGAGLSLGAVLSETGGITFLARHALNVLPDAPPVYLVYVFTLVLSFLIRQLFLQPSPCMVITLPIVIELGRITGSDPLLLAMLAAFVIGASQVLPIQSPPALLCVLGGLYSTRDQLRVVPYFLAAVAVTALVAVTIYWPLLRTLSLPP